MKTINLRKLYFSQYHEDVFVEVSDEVAEALLLMRRAENNRRQKINYYKAYSIDCVDGIEMAAIHREQLSPEDYLIELAEQDEWNCMLQRLNETLARLTPTQQRRIHARYMLKMKNKDYTLQKKNTNDKIKIYKYKIRRNKNGINKSSSKCNRKYFT